MKPTVFLLLLLSSTAWSFAQTASEKNELPDKIKRISEYKNDKLVSIRDYDLQKRLIFSYYSQPWNDKELVFMSGKIYSNEGKLIKTYSLHSNVGYSISDYEHKGKLTEKTYAKIPKDKLPENTRNTNYFFQDIANIKCLNDILSFPEITRIESKEKKILVSESILDTAGNVLTVRGYGKSGKIESLEKNEYNSQNQLTYSYRKYASAISAYEYLYEYGNGRSNSMAFNRPPNKKDYKLLQTTLILVDKDGRAKKVEEITMNNYDNKNRLIQSCHYKSGKLKSKSIYEYDSKDRMTLCKYYEGDYEKLLSETIFEYGNEDLLQKEIEINHRTSKKEESKYQYEYYQ